MQQRRLVSKTELSAAQQCAAPDATCSVAYALWLALLAGVAGELWRWAACCSVSVPPFPEQFGYNKGGGNT